MPQNFCKITTLDLSHVVPVKSTVEILQNFVAFSEYMNFNWKISEKYLTIRIQINLHLDPTLNLFKQEPNVIAD